MALDEVISSVHCQLSPGLATCDKASADPGPHKLTQSRVDVPFSGISAKHIKQFTLLATHHLDVQVRSRPIIVLTDCLHMQRKILALIFAVEWNAGSVYSSNHSMEFFEN